jgi:hypothetical protein
MFAEEDYTPRPRIRVWGASFAGGCPLPGGPLPTYRRCEPSGVHNTVGKEPRSACPRGVLLGTSANLVREMWIESGPGLGEGGYTADPPIERSASIVTRVPHFGAMPPSAAAETRNPDGSFAVVRSDEKEVY